MKNISTMNISTERALNSMHKLRSIFFSKRPWNLLPVNLNISYVQGEINV